MSESKSDALLSPPSTKAVQHGMDVLTMSTHDKSCNFAPMRAQRRAMGPEDVLIDMKVRAAFRVCT